METLINLFVRLSGLGWLWDKTDGLKTYIAASLSILTGLADVLREIAPILASHNGGALFNYIKAFPHDPGWLLIVHGIGLLGIRNAISKAATSS